ncbi:MAG TPA: hypothetical protein VIV40_04850 [Kofleriaceae bacterium]
MRTAAVAGLTAIAAFVLCVLSPLRQLSGDTVPGRIGGAVLRCAGDFDLSHVDFVKLETDHDRMFYYMQYDQIGEYSSVFGPVPAVLVSLALLDFGEGDKIRDNTLRTRERALAALLLALATALITVAARARVELGRAALTGAVCALSFAGAATLGQGIWQATTALPLLAAALATLAWRERCPRLTLATPALLLLAVMLRPTIAPLALGIGVTWLRDPEGHRWAIPDKRNCLVAIGIALVCVAPLVVWNAIHLYSPLPIGQWHANSRATEHVFSIGGAATGIAGLLVSPARGLVWFAPIVIVGVVAALRSRTQRWIGAGIVLQVVAMAAFFKWHGGQAYGPRLLAEATWVGTWLALGAAPSIGSRVSRILAVLAIVVTIFVGQLGLWRFIPEQWELPVRPEAHPSAFWWVADSPIVATFTTPPRGGPQAYDSTPTLGLRCDHGELKSLTPAD